MKKAILVKVYMLFIKAQNKLLTLSKSGIFTIKATQDKRLKILTPGQMLQKLPIALAQVKAGNLSETY